MIQRWTMTIFCDSMDISLQMSTINLGRKVFDLVSFKCITILGNSDHDSMLSTFGTTTCFSWVFVSLQCHRGDTSSRALLSASASATQRDFGISAPQRRRQRILTTRNLHLRSDVAAGAARRKRRCALLSNPGPPRGTAISRTGSRTSVDTSTAQP